jgi:hypothetical protein
MFTLKRVFPLVLALSLISAACAGGQTAVPPTIESGVTTAPTSASALSVLPGGAR